VDDIIFSISFHYLVSIFQEMKENEFQISMMRELTFFRYSSQANVASYLHTSSQAHEGPDEEVRAQARVNTDEHENGAGSR
jgi:hypothetical protein